MVAAPYPSISHRKMRGPGEIGFSVVSHWSGCNIGQKLICWPTDSKIMSFE